MASLDWQNKKLHKSYTIMIHCLNETVINFQNIQDIIYWSKKWEVSPYELMKAYYTTNTNSVRKIEEYLRSKGFAV